MSLRYSPVGLDFQRFEGSSPRATQVFVKPGKLEPILGELGKDWWPQGSTRQGYFEGQLRRISQFTGSPCIPVYIEWSGGEQNQIDKWCIGHSFSGERPLIDAVARNNRGEITHVILRNCGVDHA